MGDLSAQDAPNILVYTAEKGEFLDLRRLLHRGEDASSPNGAAALFAAVKHGHSDCVQALLDAGASTNSPQGMDALTFIAKSGELKLAWTFLDYGADVTSRAGAELLNTAALIGDLQLITKLLLRGALVSQATHSFRPGRIGIRYDETGSVQEVNAEGQARRKGIKPGDVIVKVGTEPYSKDALVRAERSGISYDVTVGSNKVASRVLQSASQQGHHEAVRLLILAGVLHLAGAEMSALALKEAAMMEHWPVVSMLLEAGVDPSAAIRCAGGKGRQFVTEKLLEFGVNPSTGLPAAAGGGHMKVVQALVQQGVDRSSAEQALKEACRFGRVDVVRLLIDKRMVDEFSEAANHSLRLAATGFDDAMAVRLAFEERMHQRQIWDNKEYTNEDADEDAKKLNELWKREQEFQDCVKKIIYAQDPEKQKKAKGMDKVRGKAVFD